MNHEETDTNTYTNTKVSTKGVFEPQGAGTSPLNLCPTAICV